MNIEGDVIRNEEDVEDKEDEIDDGEVDDETTYEESTEDALESLRESLKAFTQLRGRPSVFFLLGDSLSTIHLERLQKELEGEYFDGVEEIDLVVHSGGGDIDVAYQVIELLRHHTVANGVRINACVPRYAKSAATLLCLGADKITVHEIAQLGPLDTQIYEKKLGGEGEMISALTPFESLEFIKQFSLDFLDSAVPRFLNRSPMSPAECIDLSTKLVKIMVDPLLNKVDVEKLGDYSRALRICEEYGERLLRRHSHFKEDERTELLRKLVHEYPSHGFVIDYNELIALGFDVELFPDYEQDKAVDTLHRVTSEFVTDNELYLIWVIRPEPD